MSAFCSAEFVNSGCMCITDPMDITSKICGYVNKQNGLVYPCDLGCCTPACTNVGVIPQFNQNFVRLETVLFHQVSMSIYPKVMNLRTQKELPHFQDHTSPTRRSGNSF
jgi:hypothetical protein